jgi:hypothetical protein
VDQLTSTRMAALSLLTPLSNPSQKARMDPSLPSPFLSPISHSYYLHALPPPSPFRVNKTSKTKSVVHGNRLYIPLPTFIHAFAPLPWILPMNFCSVGHFSPSPLSIYELLFSINIKDGMWEMCGFGIHDASAHIFFFLVFVCTFFFGL